MKQKKMKFNINTYGKNGMVIISTLRPGKKKSDFLKPDFRVKILFISEMFSIFTSKNKKKIIHDKTT